MTISREHYEVPIQAYDLATDNLIDLRDLFRPGVQPICTIGCDLGSVHDHSAITVCHYDTRLVKPADWLDGFNPYPEFATHYTISMCERIPIGTSYPKVADMICKIARKLYERNQKQHLVCLVDQTGVGKAVVDLLRERIIGGCLVCGVTITGGDKGDENLLWKESSRVSKIWLVSRLQSILQGSRLHMPSTPQIQALIRELEVFEIRIKKNTGNIESGAFQVGEHDDLAISLALACAEDFQDVQYGQPLSYFSSPI